VVDAGWSMVAERTVIGALPARVTRGPTVRAAELSWGLGGSHERLAESAWMVRWARPARAGNSEAHLSDSQSVGALISGRPRRARGQIEDPNCMRLIARPAVVLLDRVAQQYARATTGLGTDQLWAALRQWGAATLTGREGL